jgi:predicted HTH transcriptional regulator
MLESEESQTFERKRSLSLQREGLESLCGMANATNSEVTVAFGIEPDGSVIGVEPGNLDKAQRSIAQAIQSRFEPRLQSRMEVRQIEGKSVILVSAQRNRAIPYHEFEGRAFIREGTVTRQLSLIEKQSLERQRNRDLHNGPWKCSGCESWVGMLSQMLITNEGVRKTYSCRCGGEFWPAG